MDHFNLSFKFPSNEKQFTLTLMASGERKMDISIYEKIYKISDYKTHPIYWLSIYLKGYFKGRYYGPGIEKIEIQIILTNALHSYEELQETYAPHFEEKFQDFNSDLEVVEKHKRFNFYCLFEDDNYRKFCEVSEEERFTIIVEGLIGSVKSFDFLPKIVDRFDKDQFCEDFISILKQKDLFFELTNFNQVKETPGIKGFYSIGKMQAAGMTIDENTDLKTMLNILVNKKKYEEKEWAERLVVRPSQTVIDKMNSVTNAFCLRLGYVDFDKLIDNNEKLEVVMDLVDKIPWLDFDTTDREFIADEIIPVLIKIGVDPELCL